MDTAKEFAKSLGPADFMMVDFQGGTVNAIYVSGSHPDDVCFKCKETVPPGKYYYIHDNGDVWHTDCHWAEGPKRPRQKPQPVPVKLPTVQPIKLRPVPTPRRKPAPTFF